MTQRQIVCTCEDVTDRDIDQAIAQGHTDLESIKRFTGIATGLCQGRQCLGRVARLLSERGGDAARLRPTTARPPLTPVPLGVLAAGVDLPPAYPGPEAPALSMPPPLPAPPPDLPSVPERAEVVVIGGGVLGLATAYHLAKSGLTDVVVLERAFINAGASGRNGGGIRQQWSTEPNVLLMKESLALWRELARELGINIWLRQGGYLFVATRQDLLDAAARNVELQNRLGVPTRVLSPAQISRIAPELDTRDLVGGCFNPNDGVLFPWPLLWGYAEGARRLGARILTFTPVTGVEVQAGRLTAVRTDRGRIGTSLAVNAAGAWAPQVAAMAGIDMPNRPERHEILVTESLKPFLDPMVSELGTGLYFSQSMRGEIVGGLGDPDEPPGVQMRSSLRFLTRMARALVGRMPKLAGVRVLRQWAGCYDVTPDGHPIIGEVEAVRGFYQLNGFVGHGFMMAPAVSRLAARHLAQGVEHPFLRMCRFRRFEEGARSQPETLIIG